MHELGGVSGERLSIFGTRTCVDYHSEKTPKTWCVHRACLPKGETRALIAALQILCPAPGCLRQPAIAMSFFPSSL